MRAELPLIDSIVSRVHWFARTSPDRPAIIAGNSVISYCELSQLIECKAASWELPHRSLVALGGDSSLEFVVAYLSLLEAGHVPILTARHIDESIHAWRPAAVATFDDRGTHVVRNVWPTPRLHEDLALLMSTSGSTGSPKLVRLSHTNLTANAEAIADYLSLTPHDRGITSLPLHYCYGLSVLHSHLTAGASIVLTNASVVDPCFRDAMKRHGVTNLAGVPHTFELLEQSRFHEIDLPRLRLMTQAGGRMDPGRVHQWAERLGRRGAELFVMYGQTEATARMAYLPPELATICPSAVGTPVPGGSIELRPHPAAVEPDVGEIVYRGPNVMMGYAEQHADLAKGPGLEELRTGDLGRLLPGGVYEIVGRASRFVKPFGLRVDLDHLERQLAGHGELAVAGDDTQLVVGVVVPAIDQDCLDNAMHKVLIAIVRITGLPERCLHVLPVAELPRTPSGKIDGAALLETALTTDRERRPVDQAVDQTVGVAALFAQILGREEVRANDTFVSLGGDSLSYIECGMRLEELLGRLPDDWHVLPISELDRSTSTATSRSFPRLDTTVLLRAFSICAVVSTHMGLYRFPGGAHLLLAVVGYNFARFQLAHDTGRARLRSGLRTAARVALPTSMWIGINMLIAGGYSLGALTLMNNYTGSAWRRDGRWQYWFFEVFVQTLVLASLLMAVPAVRRLERRIPFLFTLAMLVPLLMFRFRWWDLGDHYNYLFRTHTVAWFFVLGWSIQRASRTWQRLLISSLAIAIVPNFFGRGQRETFIILGLVMLVWIPSLPLPRVLHRPISALASASMWIFLVHWQVWPPLDAVLKREAAFALTLAVGVAAWWTASHARQLFRRTHIALSGGGTDAGHSTWLTRAPRGFGTGCVSDPHAVRIRAIASPVQTAAPAIRVLQHHKN